MSPFRCSRADKHSNRSAGCGRAGRRPYRAANVCRRPALRVAGDSNLEVPRHTTSRLVAQTTLSLRGLVPEMHAAMVSLIGEVSPAAGLPEALLPWKRSLVARQSYADVAQADTVFAALAGGVQPSDPRPGRTLLLLGRAEARKVMQPSVISCNQTRSGDSNTSFTQYAKDHGT